MFIYMCRLLPVAYCYRVYVRGFLGAMFLAYDGEANLLGMNFNEGALLRQYVIGNIYLNIHTYIYTPYLSVRSDQR